MRDALKNYLALAGGVTELTRKRALSAARALVSQGEATAEQVTALAEDLLAQTRQNREAVSALVAFEVDRALARVGLATADEVTSLTARVRELEGELRAVRRGAGATAAAGGTSARGTGADAGEAPAKTSAATKAPARRSAAAKAAPRNAADPQAAQTAAQTAAPATKATKQAGRRGPASPPAREASAQDNGVQQDLLVGADTAPEPGESPA